MLLSVSFLHTSQVCKQIGKNPHSPESAAATSRMFLKWVRRYSPRAREAGRRIYSEYWEGERNMENLLFSGLAAREAEA
jgi:hypothetical protein